MVTQSKGVKICKKQEELVCTIIEGTSTKVYHIMVCNDYYCTFYEKEHTKYFYIFLITRKSPLTANIFRLWVICITVYTGTAL
jgi:hypothetical protein